MSSERQWLILSLESQEFPVLVHYNEGKHPEAQSLSFFIYVLCESET